MRDWPRLGVGLQHNTELLGWFPFERLDLPVLEVLLDTLAGPLDSPHLMAPGVREAMARLGQRHRLLGHSNYGCEFGFLPLERSPAVLRHVPINQAIRSPWVADHCLYGDDSWSAQWSSPLRMSEAEVRRLAPRARALQDLYGVPLAHENAAFYMPCAGSTMPEGEFLRALVEEADTYLHLDLHNAYTNSLNLAGYDLAAFLDALPMERVIAIHLSGGSWHEGLYHDWHDSAVPEPVWALLDEVLGRARPGALILEYQGRAHHPSTPELDRRGAVDMVLADLARAQAAWGRHA